MDIMRPTGQLYFLFILFIFIEMKLFIGILVREVASPF